MKNDAGRTLRRLASRGPKPRILNFPRLTPKPAQATWGQKITTALKEWGPVATLLIAILYTYPVGLMDRLTSTREKQLSSSFEFAGRGCASGPCLIATFTAPGGRW